MLANVLDACARFEKALARVRNIMRRKGLVTPNMSALVRALDRPHAFPLTPSTFIVQPVLQWYRHVTRYPRGTDHAARTFVVLNLDAYVVARTLNFATLVLTHTITVAERAYQGSQEGAAAASEGIEGSGGGGGDTT